MANVNSLDLSIIILSYKSKDHLAVLLASIFQSEGIIFGTPNDFASSADNLYKVEVIVVDNDSQDGTVEFVEQYAEQNTITLFHGRKKVLKIIKNVNNGFSRGNNLGIKQALGKYILLLNPDTKVSPNTFKIMLDFMESRPDVGISGCKLVKADGSLDLACRRRFPNPWNSFLRLFLKNNSNYNYTDISDTTSMEVDSVVGAFLLISRLVINKIGLLDEDFFMYGEDLDWCWRCKEAGYKVWYFAETTVLHFKGQSSKKRPYRSLKVFYDSMWIFYQKHYQKKYFFLFNWLVWFGIYGRLGLLLMINLFKKNPIVSK